MPDNLLSLLRKRLADLKHQARLSDAEIATAMRESSPSVTAYQQKVSDFFSGEMKRPDLDFIRAICMALGVTIADMFAGIERNAPVTRDRDWDWLMFGRQLGPDGRAAAREFVDGVKSPAPAGASKRHRARRRRPGAEKA